MAGRRLIPYQRGPRHGRVGAGSLPGGGAGRCGINGIQAIISAAMIAAASVLLMSGPPSFKGLSKKSPTVAPSGRVSTKAAQNSAVPKVCEKVMVSQ